MANAEVKKAAASKKFDPASLSYEEAGLVLENFLGVHPKYFIYESGQIKLNQCEIGSMPFAAPPYRAATPSPPPTGSKAHGVFA